MDIVEDDALKLAGVEPGQAWPERLGLGRFIALLTGADRRSKAGKDQWDTWADRIDRAAADGRLAVETTRREIPPAEPLQPILSDDPFLGSASREWWREFPPPPPRPRIVTERFVSRTSAAAWLHGLGVPIPPHAVFWLRSGNAKHQQGQKGGEQRRPYDLIRHDAVLLVLEALERLDPDFQRNRMPGRKADHLTLYAALCPELQFNGSEDSLKRAKAKAAARDKWKHQPGAKETDYYRQHLPSLETDPTLTEGLAALVAEFKGTQTPPA